MVRVAINILRAALPILFLSNQKSAKKPHWEMVSAVSLDGPERLGLEMETPSRSSRTGALPPLVVYEMAAQINRLAI
jgi:hypothetical protein